jgi:hypothetical protein
VIRAERRLNVKGIGGSREIWIEAKWVMLEARRKDVETERELEIATTA